MPKYKYSKRIVLGYTEDGEEVRKRIYADTKRELDKLAKEAVESFVCVPAKESAVSFREYSQKWLSTYKSTREYATQEMYHNALLRMKSLEDMPITDITLTDLQQIIADNVEHPSTCAKIRLTMGQIWACAVEDGILSTNIAKRVETPKTCVKQGRALLPIEKDAIRNADLDPKERMYMYLLYFLGLRPQEALALLPSDFDGDTVIIQRAVGYDVNRPYIKTTKTNSVRSLPVPYALLSLLEDYKTNSYLIDYHGDLMTKTVKSDFWLRIRKKLFAVMNTETDLRPYTFRHNYATECYYSGISLKKCQYLLGHSSLQMILQVYAHLDDEQESLDRLRSLDI